MIWEVSAELDADEEEAAAAAANDSYKPKKVTWSGVTWRAWVVLAWGVNVGVNGCLGGGGLGGGGGNEVERV